MEVERERERRVCVKLEDKVDDSWRGWGWRWGWRERERERRVGMKVEDEVDDSWRGWGGGGEREREGSV